MSESVAELSTEQQKALEILKSGENVFLTGGAGSGKSFLIRQFMQTLSHQEVPILASTGAAAVLVGGRTFHSFFGLGIMEGGPQATFERGSRDRRVMKRLKQVEGFIIDEISMIPGQAFAVAEALSRQARESQLPWGGLRVIVVGDFAQLPPVSRGQGRDWAFKNTAWQRTSFIPTLLSYNHRVQENEYLAVLADVRAGKSTPRVKKFLDERVRDPQMNDEDLRLMPRRDQSENFNRLSLEKIANPEMVFEAIYFGEAKGIDAMKKYLPVPDTLVFKEGAKVMFVQNDPQRKWVNGTRGTIVGFAGSKIIVELNRRRDVEVERTLFSMQDADGNVVASMLQYPLVLAYATTIHKSQGATLERLWVDLRALWEPGQAYVALSRLVSSDGLNLLGWSPRSIIVDPEVSRFFDVTFPSELR